MEQSYQINENWAAIENLDFCFLVIFGLYGPGFASGREIGQ